MTICTDNTETLVNALQKIADLEAVTKTQRLRIETLEEALAGAHRIIQQGRDRGSVLPALDNSAPTP